jgi:hypothetical protein
LLSLSTKLINTPNTGAQTLDREVEEMLTLGFRRDPLERLLTKDRHTQILVSDERGDVATGAHRVP